MYSPTQSFIISIIYGSFSITKSVYVLKMCATVSTAPAMEAKPEIFPSRLIEVTFSKTDRRINRIITWHGDIDIKIMVSYLTYLSIYVIYPPFINLSSSSKHIFFGIFTHALQWLLLFRMNILSKDITSNASFLLSCQLLSLTSLLTSKSIPLIVSPVCQHFRYLDYIQWV